MLALTHHVAQRAAGAVDEPVDTGVDGVLGVAEHVHHELRCGVDEALASRFSRLRIVLLVDREPDDPRQHGHRSDDHSQRHQGDQRPMRLAARRGPAGRDNRTLTVFGVSTGTPVDWGYLPPEGEREATAPLAAPAARDARRPPAALDSVIYACLGANIRSTQFSAGASLSFPPANTPVPPAGSTNFPFWSYVARLAIGFWRAAAPRQAAVAHPPAVPAAAPAHPPEAAASGRTAARPDRAARRTATGGGGRGWFGGTGSGNGACGAGPGPGGTPGGSCTTGGPGSGSTRGDERELVLRQDHPRIFIGSLPYGIGGPRHGLLPIGT